MADPLVPLLACLRDFLALCKRRRITAMIIGGAATALLGRTRMTRDLDATVWIPEVATQDFFNWAQSAGFEPRYSNYLEWAIRDNVFLLRHQSSLVDLDVTRAWLPFEQEALARRIWIKRGNLRIPVPRPEDFVILKAIANRPRDLIDIEGVLDRHPELDLDRIRGIVKDFAEALEMPEVALDLDRLLQRRHKGK